MHDANNWYYGWGWGWFLWLGFIFLFFSSLGNWGYTYSAHRKYGQWPTGNARAILDERYARGELTREQFSQLKADLAAKPGRSELEASDHAKTLADFATSLTGRRSCL